MGGEASGRLAEGCGCGVAARQGAAARGRSGVRGHPLPPGHRRRVHPPGGALHAPPLPVRPRALGPLLHALRDQCGLLCSGVGPLTLTCFGRTISTWNPTLSPLRPSSLSRSHQLPILLGGSRQQRDLYSCYGSRYVGCQFGASAFSAPSSCSPVYLLPATPRSEPGAADGKKILGPSSFDCSSLCQLQAMHRSERHPGARPETLVRSDHRNTEALGCGREWHIELPGDDIATAAQCLAA